MKIIVPFDHSVAPPKRFWSALLKPAVQPENPAADLAAMRLSLALGAPYVLLDQAEHLRVKAVAGAWEELKRALGGIGEWFQRRDAVEREERSAAADGLDALTRQAHLRDIQRTRHLRM